MSSFNKQVTVPYTAEQMYDLVNDINAYPKFIPLCISSEVHEERDHKLRATIKIAKGKIGFGFTTLNTLEKGRSIPMNLENGPFKSLKGVWGLHRQEPMNVLFRCILTSNFPINYSALLWVAYSNSFAIQWLNHFANRPQSFMATERDQNHMDKFISDQVYIDWVTSTLSD